jgi:hypothetical protein
MSWLFMILFTFAFIWVSIISYGQVTTNILVSSIFTIPNSIFITFPFIQSALIILPFLPFAVFLKNHFHRAIIQTWILTALVGVMLAPIQLAGQTSAQWRAVIGIGLGFICIALVMLLGWLKYSHNFPPRFQRIVQLPGSISIIIIFLAVYSYSWLIWGSLGSMIDTI